MSDDYLLLLGRRSSVKDGITKGEKAFFGKEEERKTMYLTPLLPATIYRPCICGFTMKAPEIVAVHQPGRANTSGEVRTKVGGREREEK